MADVSIIEDMEDVEEPVVHENLIPGMVAPLAVFFLVGY
jgi:hypothetical protein